MSYNEFPELLTQPGFNEATFLYYQTIKCKPPISKLINYDLPLIDIFLTFHRKSNQKNQKLPMIGRMKINNANNNRY